MHRLRKQASLSQARHGGARLGIGGGESMNTFGWDASQASEASHIPFYPASQQTHASRQMTVPGRNRPSPDGPARGMHETASACSEVHCCESLLQPLMEVVVGAVILQPGQMQANPWCWPSVGMCMQLPVLAQRCTACKPLHSSSWKYRQCCHPAARTDPSQHLVYISVRKCTCGVL